VTGNDKLKLGILVGSTRPTRAADKVLPWVVRRASAHTGFDVEVFDLRDWELPFFGEHMGTIGDIADPTYSQPVVKTWNRKMAELDCLLVVTPEYLHSLPGVLKNALDSVFVSFALRNKPLAAVAYSGGVAAGVRAVEHLAHIAIESEMAPVRNTVLIPFVGEAFGPDGDPVDRRTERAMTVMLDDLEWWGRALAAARAAGELLPGTFRMRVPDPG